ncbi:MAG: hypothetical protein ACXADA_14210 [Candidatus Hodarchaeales archaeon]
MDSSISSEFLNFIKQYKTDHEHGASYLTSSLLSALFTELISIVNREEQEKIILWTCREIKNFHQDMIEIVNVHSRLLEQPTLETVKLLKDQYLSIKNATSNLASRWLLDNHVHSILTTSHSSLVEETLVKWATIYFENYRNDSVIESLHIHCLESRPKFEGRILLKRVKDRLSKRVEGSKFHLHLWADSGMNLALNNVDCVILGADRIFNDFGIVNKIGSLSMAVLARLRSIPVIVVASSFKKDHKKETSDHSISVCFEQHRHEASELLSPDEMLSVDVENYYFEIVPPDYLTVIVIEDQLIELH